MCEICFIRRKSESTESVADFVTTAGAVGNGTQDLRTRHAVSDNKRKKRTRHAESLHPRAGADSRPQSGIKTGNGKLRTLHAASLPLTAPRSSAPRKGGGDYSRVSGQAVHHTPSARRTGVCSPHKAQMDIQSIF